MHDWTHSLDEWVDFLVRQGWPIGVGEQLRLQVLARQLRAQGIPVASAEDAARWFGPLLARSAADQQRLPQLLQSWLPAPATVAEALPTELARVARAVVPPPPTRSALWIRVALGVAVLLVMLLVFRFWSLSDAFPALTEPAPAAVVAPRGPPTLEAMSMERRLWGALLWSMPFLVAWAVRRLRRRRTAVLMRGVVPRDAPREALHLRLSALALYTLLALRAAVADLRRHRLVEATWIDGARSVGATVAQGGRVVLVPGKRRAVPEYLVLVDIRGRDDILGALADMLVQLLQEGDVQVTRYDFIGDPRRLRRVVRRDGKSEVVDSTDLQTLRSTCPDHRLLIVGDAAGFADAQGRQVRSWVQELRQWPEVALLTPLPPVQWGPRERALTRLGVCLAQATPEGLRSLARVFRSDRQGDESLLGSASTAASGSSAQATRLDRRIAADPYRWLGDAIPPVDDQLQLLQELREVLNPSAMLYLQALAVFPVLNPGLTLTLGRLLDDGHGRAVLNEATLVQLCRVPWLRAARLPDWLRLLLLRDLARSAADPRDSDAESRVRAAWATLLAPAADAGGERLPLEVVRAVDPALPAVVARALAQSGRRDDREGLLLAFMNREALPELGVVMPAQRSQQARDAGKNARWEAGLLTLALLFAALGGWLAPQAWDTSSIQRARWADAAWALGITMGMACLISWYSRELGPQLTGRWARLAPAPGSEAIWRVLPESFSVAALSLALAAVQLVGDFASTIGPVVVAVELVLWCFLAPGRQTLRWAPPLMLLQCSVDLKPDASVVWSGGAVVSAEQLALVVVAWLGLRHRWDDLRAMLWMTAPVSALQWSLGPRLSIGHGLASFVLMALAGRISADADFRRRWLGPQRLDSPAWWVLIVPLGVHVSWSPVNAGLGFGWAPTVLLLLAMFMVGQSARRAALVLTTMVLWGLAATLARLTAWPWDWSAWFPASGATVWYSGLIAASPGYFASALLAWWFGRAHAGGTSRRAVVVGLMLAFVGLSVTLIVSTRDRSLSAPLVFIPVLLLGLLPACRLLDRRTLWTTLGLGTLIWVAMLVLGALGLKTVALIPGLVSLGPSEASLAPIGSILALAAGASVLIHLRLSGREAQGRAPETGAEPPRLLLLDWGRWTVPAVVLALCALLVPLGFKAAGRPRGAPAPASAAPPLSREVPPEVSPVQAPVEQAIEPAAKAVKK